MSDDGMTAGAGWRSDYGEPGRPAGADLLRPLSLGDVLDGMFRLLFGNLRPYAIALGVVIVPVQLVVVWFQREALGGLSLFQQITDPAAAAAAQQGSGAFGAVNFLLTVVTTPYITGVAIALAVAALWGRRVEVGDSARLALGRYGALLVFGILAGLASLVALLPVFFLLFAAGAAVVAGGAGPGAALGFGLAAAVVGFLSALVIGALLGLGPPAIVAERIGPFRGFARGVSLGARSFWRLLGRLLVVGIVLVAIVAVLFLVLAVATGAFGGVIGYVLQALVSIVVSFVSTALLWNALTLLYADTRVRSEGLDLELRSEQLGQPIGEPFREAPPA
jgi:hypothetical protein